MSTDDSKGDPIGDLREHQSAINLIDCVLMAIKDIGGRDTREIEHRLHEMLGRETHENHNAIDRMESAEDDPEAHDRRRT